MNGTLTYEGPNPLRANQLFSAVLTIAPGVEIVPGGRLVLASRHFSDVGVPQMTEPLAENYISVHGGDGAAWELGRQNDWDRHPWNRGIDLKLAAGKVKATDTITVHLGDPAAGGPGFRCQSFVETTFHFRLGIDPDGSGAWQVAKDEDMPSVRIIGNAPVNLAVSVSDVTGDGTSRVVHLKPEDTYGNIAAGPIKGITLSLDVPGSVPAAVTMNDDGPSVCRIDVPADGKMHRLTAASADGTFCSESNPFGTSPVESMNLYWGEIHSQSGLCDGTNMPDEHYAYARDAVGLDFAAVSSHDNELSAADWEILKQAARDAHRPGEFVTFLGYEWSGKTDTGGDNNIYFLDDDGPLVHSYPWPGAPAWDAANGEVTRTRTIAETIAKLKATGRPFMVVPHGGGRRCNLDFFDPSAMPMLEIHSCHRSFHGLIETSLTNGLKMGFIGGSDDHRGALGDSHLVARDRFFSAHSGLIGVYARELTRESLWEAFFARRVYATNGPRIMLDFRIGGVLMGGELTAEAGSTVAMGCHAVANGIVDQVELFCGTTPILRLTAGGYKALQFRESYDLTVREGLHPYYVRLRQDDGGTAWSSPIWVTGA